MKRPSSQIWLCIGGMAALGAIFVNAWLSWSPLDISPLSASQKNAAEPTIGSDESISTNLDLAEALARPLFSPTRREFEPAPVAEQVVEQVPAAIAAPPVTIAATKPSFSLQGIRQIGLRPAALILASPQSVPDWYEVGQTIDGWTLSEIRKDGISVRNSSATHDVGLYDQMDGANAR